MPNINSIAHELYDSVIDFLFPPVCPVCSCPFDAKDIICPVCTDAIEVCSHNYDSPARTLGHIDNISVLLPYNTMCRSLVHALKYHGMKSVGPVLGKLMGRKTLNDFRLPANTCLVPVPLHPNRFKERGYNQSECIAEGFAFFSGFDMCDDILMRAKETGTQTALDHKQRSRNVSDAFRYTGEKSLLGRQVVIIDDVMTTGSTISECAKALKEGGAGEITVSVVATPDIGMD